MPVKRLTRWLRLQLRDEPAEKPSGFDLDRMRAWLHEPVAATEPPSERSAALPTPGPLKTRIAREAMVAVTPPAGRPIGGGGALGPALADERVQAARVSRGTVGAQLTAALAEEPARIVRVCHGIYAAV